MELLKEGVLIKAIVNEVHQGIPLSEENALILYEKAPLHQLLQAAHRVSFESKSNSEVTYLVDRNVSITPMFVQSIANFVHFIALPVMMKHTEINEISDRVTELEQIGGSRILMQGGVNPSLGMSYYIDLLKQLRVKHPST